MENLFGKPQLPPPPKPPAVPTIDQARIRQEASDAQLRKRGARQSVLTGPEGVGNTPVQVKSLIGS